MMRFEKLNSTKNCDCLSGSIQNITDEFIRRVRKSSELKDPDFRTHVERNKIPENPFDCEELCGFNAVSFEIWTEESSKEILKRHSYSAEIAPKLNNYCVIKFKSDSGVVKHTPNQQHGYNKYHYDFYKDDDFKASKLELVQMIEF